MPEDRDAAVEYSPPAADAPEPRRGLTGPALWVALLILLGWGSFIVVLVLSASVEEVRWTRLAWLFSSVEAVVFAAAGALFGTTIQRRRAERAEAAAEANAKDASNGRALASALLAEDEGAEEEAAPAAGTAGGLEGFRSSPAAPEARRSAAQVARRHARLARSLFPPGG
jgi:hypothetical protein